MYILNNRMMHSNLHGDIYGYDVTSMARDIAGARKKV